MMMLMIMKHDDNPEKTEDYDKIEKYNYHHIA